MKIRILLFIIILAISTVAYAKRAVPKKVDPIIRDNYVYMVPHWAHENGTEQNGGYIEVLDVKEGIKVWGIQIYKTKYDSKTERDVQDVFITNIEINLLGTKLKVIDELGRQYEVGLCDKSISKTK